jgi:hypothetical protein
MKEVVSSRGGRLGGWGVGGLDAWMHGCMIAWGGLRVEVSLISQFNRL